jgi:hypothetical protein
VSGLDVYSTTLRAWVPLELLEALDVVLAQGGGFTSTRKGNGEHAVIDTATFTGVRENSPAFALCAGLAGATCLRADDGTARFYWCREQRDEALPHRAFTHDLALRETERPAAN